MPEITPELKKSAEITQQELDQMHAIYRKIDPNMPEDHIRVNHINVTEPVFQLFKKEGEILAFQAYSVFHLKTPFARKPIPVINLNLSYKDLAAGDEVKNFAKSGNLMFIRKTLGPFWFLKRFVNVLQSYNPRLVSRISRSFPVSFPEIRSETPAEVVDFSREIFNQKLKIKSELNQHLVKQHLYPVNSDISKKWETHYASNDDHFNHFFEREGILIKDGKRVHLTGKAVFFVGYYSFGGAIRKVLGRK